MIAKAVTHYRIALELPGGSVLKHVGRASQSKRVDGGVL
jgi:hypothetical protein